MLTYPLTGKPGGFIVLTRSLEASETCRNRVQETVVAVDPNCDSVDDLIDDLKDHDVWHEERPAGVGLIGAVKG